MAASPDFDVFMSYSRDPLDQGIAARLQEELQRFARPWYRPGARILRVFRDQTNLPSSTDLWGAIEDAMLSSRWLLLVASPHSAQSAAVRRELTWWLEKRGPANICIVLADGEIRWNEAADDFDWSVTTALSHTAVGKIFTREPAWIDVRSLTRGDGTGRHGPLRRFGRSLADPRLQDAAASLLAQIRQIPKDALIGEHLRRTRQTRRAVTSTLLMLVVLLAASITAASVATTQRNRAINQATISESGQLAALAESLTNSNLDLAELFAAEAYRLHPDPQTRAALFQTVTADPHLVRYLQATGTVSAVAASADANAVVAGTSGGDILRWDLTGFKRTLVARLPAAVSSVAISGDGSTIAAAGGPTAEIWSQGQGVQSVPVPHKLIAETVAVSPSGRYVAFSFGPGDNSGSYLVLVDESADHAIIARTEIPYGATNLSFSGETSLITLENSVGYSERLAIPRLTKISASQGRTPAQNYAWTLSPTGRYISFTNGTSPLPIWTSLASPASAQEPALGAPETGNAPEAIAISADGKRAAEADSGTIHVADITTYEHASSSSQLTLTGNSKINYDALAFIGRGNTKLVSASNDLIALWDLNQYSRISTEASAEIPMGCMACGGPSVYISPKENYAVITAASGFAMTTIRLPVSAGHVRTLFTKAASVVTYGPVVWSPDGKEFSVISPANGGGQVWSAARAPVFLRDWPVSPAPGGKFDSEMNPPAWAALTPNGRQILEIDAAGNVVARNSATGAVERTTAVPASVDSVGGAYAYLQAADPEGKYAAKIGGPQGEQAHVIDLKTGTAVIVPGGTASSVAYAGEFLLVQRLNGTLEVRTADGQHLIHSFVGMVNPMTGPVVSSTGLAVEMNSGGTAVIFDVASGQEVGSITLGGGRQIAYTGLAFSPNGDHLVTATSDFGGPGQVTEWTFSPDQWSKIACASAGHRLTAQEWQEFVGPSSPEMPRQIACET
jgi:WD40 repeat protein